MVAGQKNEKLRVREKNLKGKEKEGGKGLFGL